MADSNMLSALGGFRVLELGDELGHYCGKLLADLGAEVIKVEPSEGVASRRRGPFAGGESHPEKSLRFLYFNANKYSVTLDLEEPAGRAAFRKLAQTADAVVESLPPGYLKQQGLDYAALSRLNPGLAMVSLSGFGQSGPYKDYKGPDTVTFALGGQMAHIGNPPKPPLAPPGEISYHLTGVHAAAGLLMALFHRHSTGRGQHLDISVQEVLAQGGQLLNYSALRQIAERGDEGGGRSDAIAAKDGYITIGFYTMSRRNWQDFVAWLGNPEGLRDPTWADRYYRRDHSRRLNEIVETFTRGRPKQEVYEDGQSHGLIMAPYNSPGDFVADPHFNARGYFAEASHPVVGRYRTPGPPYRLSATPWAQTRPAPLLGEHNSLLLSESSAPTRRKGRPLSRRATGGQGQQILPHLRVLDFTRAIAGPYLVRFLGEQGAQVIKVESSAQMQQRGTRPGQDLRIARGQQASFADLNRNKLDITLNMRTEEGQRLARELASISDVVVDNFSPRVMAGWGLDFASLHAMNPAIIAVSLPGYGTTGPHRDFLGAVNIFHAVTGLSYLWNYPGETRPSSLPTLLGDYNGGMHGATAVMAALIHREQTGQGQFIDVAQVEAQASLLGPVYLGILFNGAKPEPKGNSRDDAAPYGCFRCAGEDRWCVISVTTEEEWRALCDVLAHPAWTEEPRFATAAGRVAHREELERLLGEWTSQRTPHQVMGLLQAAGVPAGAIQNAEDVYRDPQLRERGFITEVHHPDVGRLEHPGPPIRFSVTPSVLRPYPLMGEHNRDVFCELLGLSETELDRLIKEEVVV